MSTVLSYVGYSLKSMSQREAASGVGRLKWDAKVRMKQAKLRAAGEIMDRQEVVEVIIEESVQAAQDGVMKRFEEIAAERGFDDEKTVGENLNIILPCLFGKFPLITSATDAEKPRGRS